MTSDPPSFAVGVALRHPDGEVVERVDLRWRVPPSAADVLRELMGRRLAARRRGLRLEVDKACPEVVTVLTALGLS